MNEFKNIEQLFENAPIGIFETTIDGKFVDLNTEFVRILGYESKQDVFQHIKRLEYDLYEFPGLRNEILESIAQKNKLSVFEVRFKQKNGNLIDVRMSIRHHYNEQMKQTNNIGIIEDITEKVRTEAKRKEQEKKYKTLFENSTDAILIIKHPDIIEWNTKAHDLFCGNIECNGIPDFNTLHPEKQPDNQNSLKKATRLIEKTLNGEPQFFEWELKKVSGETFFAEITLSLLDSEKKLTQAIVRDITERKKAEQKLSESEHKYRKIVETAPDGIITVSKAGIMLDVNNSFCALTGYPKEKYLNNHYDVFTGLTEESKKSSYALFNSLLNNEPVKPIEIQWTHQKGELKTGEVRAIAFYDQNRDFVMQVNLRDITLQKRAMQTIVKRESLLNSIFNSIPLELWVLDKNKNILAQSGFSKNKWGDYIGKNATEFPAIVDKERYDEILKQVNKGEVVEFVGEFSLENKRKYFKSVLAPYYENAEIKGHIAFSLDITELKQMQKELESHKHNLEALVEQRTEEIQALNEQLTDSNEKLEFQRDELKNALSKLQSTQNQFIHTEKMASIGILTAGIAHEINNPVNFIHSGIMGLEIMLSDLMTELKDVIKTKKQSTNNLNINRYSEKTTELVKAIKTGVNRITNIVNGLRTFSRMDNEEKSPVDIEETINSSLIILQNKFKYNVEISKKLAENNTVNGFPGKMGQVILNIIMNAIQAITDTGNIEIRTRRNDQKNEFKIIVQDDGIGMDKTTQEKLFDPFFTTKKPGEGTGIGMSIVHTIIEDHNGKIHIDSEPGKGSVFTIVLPIE
ncbi:Sensor protein ZraS [Salinivirga cyanobacteriivorans]|uniref:histidine kinase n=1 Tax=Salinivirga cyanobacteriivorans TaxID=1307839 RepID=A0A0S2I3U3_9BACT|nr:PAS domain S-box protein [Salinivirga cyanobacteriivorans]ALO16948.1 Sensor protein ZraS [Salinivirga cyanobacteriivorans]